MSRKPSNLTEGELSFPRSRGDEPVAADFDASMSMFSPLTRG